MRQEARIDEFPDGTVKIEFSVKRVVRVDAPRPSVSVERDVAGDVVSIVSCGSVADEVLRTWLEWRTSYRFGEERDLERLVEAL